MGKRFTIGRAGAVVAIAAITASVAAMPAAADTARGKLTEGGDSGFVVNLTNKEKVEPRLLNLTLNDDSLLRVYCIEVSVDASFDANMVENGWDKYPVQGSPFNKNRDKINWVLHHGFPGASLEELGKLPLNFDGGLAQNEAITATQTAIWHFSDGVDIDQNDPISKDDPEYDAGSAKDVLALYGYLTGEKNTGISEQVIGDLKITPDTATGAIGGKVGPFKVTTNGTVTDIEGDLPEGVTLVTGDGKSLEDESTEVTNGTELYYQVAEGTAPGNASFKLTAESPAVETGRLFVSETYAQDPAQSVIVASSETKPLTASAKGSWDVAPVATTTPAAPTTTPIPQGSPGADLADTGASILVPALIGLGLVGAGAGALVYQRRRKTA